MEIHDTRTGRRRGRTPLLVSAAATVLLAASISAIPDAGASVPPRPPAGPRSSATTSTAPPAPASTPATGSTTSAPVPRRRSNLGTGEIETMTNSTANVFQDGAGHLVIKPIRDGAGNWTSRPDRDPAHRLRRPGRRQAARRGLAPAAQRQRRNGAGYWPAFWMLGAAARGTGATNWPSIGEIDIMEDINGRSSVFGTLHCGTNPGGPCNETTGLGSGERACAGCQTGFHTYAVEIDRSVVAGADPLVPRRQQLLHPQRQPGRRDHLGQRDRPRRSSSSSTWRWAAASRPRSAAGPTAATMSGVPMIVDYVAAYTGRRRRTAAATPPPPSGKAITGSGGLCLDVRSANTANGNPVQLWACNGTGAQQWTYVEAGSTLHALGKCLDVAGGGTANGTKVQIWDCNSTGAQVFIHQADGTLLQPAGQQVPRRPGRVDDAGHPGADLGLQRRRQPAVEPAHLTSPSPVPRNLGQVPARAPGPRRDRRGEALKSRPSRTESGVCVMTRVPSGCPRSWRGRAGSCRRFRGAGRAWSRIRRDRPARPAKWRRRLVRAEDPRQGRVRPAAGPDRVVPGGALLASVDHPGLMGIHEVGEHDGRLVPGHGPRPTAGPSRSCSNRGRWPPSGPSPWRWTSSSRWPRSTVPAWCTATSSRTTS